MATEGVQQAIVQRTVANPEIVQLEVARLVVHLAIQAAQAQQVVATAMAVERCLLRCSTRAAQEAAITVLAALDKTETVLATASVAALVMVPATITAWELVQDSHATIWRVANAAWEWVFPVRHAWHRAEGSATWQVSVKDCWVEQEDWPQPQ